MDKHKEENDTNLNVKPEHNHGSCRVSLSCCIDLLYDSQQLTFVFELKKHVKTNNSETNFCKVLTSSAEF